ncbi:helix-turn-helix domain-containing protein [Paraburkholderia sp. SIMBA_030]|uniref:helix-turn-helix domain-containing protein n=1 Tax=Paraburkholderia sp. SIMBA_030 TaxID=3085773 RepID=UPI00397E1E0E
MKTFIDRLKEAVELRERETGEKIQKKELAAAAGVTSSAVTLWYKGTTANVKADAMFRLARFLRVRVEWLKYGRGSIKPDSAEPELFHAEPGDWSALIEPALSPDAKKLVERIIAADQDKQVAKEIWKAMSAIVHGLTHETPDADTISGPDAILIRAVAEAGKLPGNKFAAKKSRSKIHE